MRSAGVVAATTDRQRPLGAVSGSAGVVAQPTDRQRPVGAVSGPAGSKCTHFAPNVCKMHHFGACTRSVRTKVGHG